MPSLRSVAVLALLTPACPSSVEPPTRVEAPQLGEADAPAKATSVERAATVKMPAHFADLLEVHSSLIRGAVDDAKRAATVIAEERPSVVLDGWAPYLSATQVAARAVADAGDLEGAAAAAASLARSCGECHAAQAAGLARADASPPASDAPLMRRHKWAFDRLWEALVLPSDAAWRDGVGAFVELPSCDAARGGPQDLEAIRRARQRVRALEQAAAQADTLEARAKVYGELLPTCATCHAGGC